MTYTAPLFGTTPLLGTDVTTAGVDQPFTLSTSTPEYPGTPLKIGTEITISGGGVAVYAQCSTSAGLTAGDFCYINSTFQAAGLTSTIAATAGQAALLGVSMATLTTSQYGFFQLSGNMPGGVHVLNGVAANTVLHTSATAGVLTGTAVTGTSYPINNIMTLATSAGTSQAIAAVAGAAMIINTATTLG